MPGASTSSCPGGQPFMLEPRDPVLYFVQRLRDEAHRFAIGSHRAKRSKAIPRQSARRHPRRRGEPPAGATRHFGSAKAISRAGFEDLKAVEGISDAMAEAIYDYFREGKGVRPMANTFLLGLSEQELRLRNIFFPYAVKRMS